MSGVDPILAGKQIEQSVIDEAAIGLSREIDRSLMKALHDRPIGNIWSGVFGSEATAPNSVKGQSLRDLADAMSSMTNESSNIKRANADFLGKATTTFGALDRMKFWFHGSPWGFMEPGRRFEMHGTIQIGDVLNHSGPPSLPRVVKLFAWLLTGDRGSCPELVRFEASGGCPSPVYCHGQFVPGRFDAKTGRPHGGGSLAGASFQASGIPPVRGEAVLCPRTWAVLARVLKVESSGEEGDGWACLVVKGDGTSERRRIRCKRWFVAGERIGPKTTEQQRKEIVADMSKGYPATPVQFISFGSDASAARPGTIEPIAARYAVRALESSPAPGNNEPLAGWEAHVWAVAPLVAKE